MQVRSCYPFHALAALFLILALLGSLSPLLTLAWLWQVKEWRWDRLREHLRREGWLGQLWGRTRPVILAIYFTWLALPALSVIEGRSEATKGQTVGWFEGIVLGACAGLTVLQIAFRCQRRPVFTSKALTLTGTAALLTLLIALFLPTHYEAFLPVVILLQPLTLAAAWLLWYPIDALLKARIIAQARKLRAKFPDLTVIGVTGSVGKTTTKELLACVLKDLKPAVTPAYVNAELGVARWLFHKLQTTNYKLFIVEMGAYRKGEIALLCSFVQPTLGVVTHVGNQHIALFGSQKNLYEAKAELVTCLPLTGRVFLNGDNELCRTMAAVSVCPAVIVGTGGRCDLEAFDIEETSKGIRFRARDALFDVPLHGTHNVTNILLAIAVGEHMGIRIQRMQELLREFTPLSKTFSVREERGVRILDDTHNSSLASVKAAIAWARAQPEEHKILLTSGLIEMGEMQSPAEQELGANAGNVFERTIVLDEASAKNFASGGAKNVEIFSKHSPKIPSGSLLVCTGRMPQSSIKHLLPSSFPNS